MQTDNESARLSNVQTYKYNQLPNKLKDNPNAVNIKKIHPGANSKPPMSRNQSRNDDSHTFKSMQDPYKASSVLMPSNGMRSVVGIPDHYGADSTLSGVSTGVNTNLLP